MNCWRAGGMRGSFAFDCAQGSRMTAKNKQRQKRDAKGAKGAKLRKGKQATAEADSRRG